MYELYKKFECLKFDSFGHTGVVLLLAITVRKADVFLLYSFDKQLTKCYLSVTLLSVNVFPRN